MLEKTLAMIADIRPGTYLPDGVQCYDLAELDAFGRVVQRLLYSPSSLRRVLQDKYGVTLTRADKYGEIPTIAALERSFQTRSPLTLDAAFPDNSVMIAELERLMRVSHEFDPAVTSGDPGVYVWENGAFSYSDAMAYYTMIRTRRPRTIVEIGGGWHTRVALMACARNGLGRIVCIDPEPDDFLTGVAGIELIQRPIRDVETELINALLRDGDMLFVNSTHTVRHDGDCLHIYLRILPGIDAAIVAQAHNIYLPDAMALDMMRDQQIYWNEQYLLYGYMLGNPRTRAVYGSRYHERYNSALLERFMHGRFRAGGASFWFEQKRRIAVVEN